MRTYIIQPDPNWLLDAIRNQPNNGLLRYRGIKGSPTIHVTDPSFRRAVLSTQAYSDFEKPLHTRQRLSTFSGEGLLVAEGDVHKTQRRQLLPAFSLQHVRSLVPLFWSKSRELVDALENHIVSSGQCEVPIYDWTSRAALDIIGTAAWGKDFGSIADPDTDFVQRYRSLFVQPSFGKLLLQIFIPAPIALRLPLPEMRRVKGAVRASREAAEAAVKERHEDPKQSLRKDILSVAMRNERLDDKILVDTLLTFLAAGHETSASAAQFACFQLAKNPKIQERLRAEVRQHLPSLRSEQDMTARELESLPYLRGVTLEALRMHPPVPSGERRVAIRDTVVCGHSIPAGTEIFSHAWVTNRLGWDRAEEFDPERWLGEEAEKRKYGSSGDFEFSPFSHGTRACIGAPFARLEQLALIACLTGRFRFTLCSDPNPQMVFAVTVAPTEPIALKMEPLAGW